MSFESSRRRTSRKFREEIAELKKTGDRNSVRAKEHDLRFELALIDEDEECFYTKRLLKQARRYRSIIIPEKPKWSDPLELDRKRGEVRMPMVGKVGGRDERAAEIFRGIQAAGSGRAFEQGVNTWATEPTAGCVIGVNSLLEETLRGGRVSRGGIKQRERAAQSG
jgi:hypothetical protein